MILADALFVVVIALVVGGVFSLGFQRFGARPPLLWFFLILFFGTWAMGVWIEPIGPETFGVYWLPYLIVAIALALLVGTAVLGPPHTPARKDPGEHRAEVVTEHTLGVLFWLLLLLMVAAILLHYVLAGPDEESGRGKPRTASPMRAQAGADKTNDSTGRSMNQIGHQQPPGSTALTLKRTATMPLRERMNLSIESRERRREADRCG